MLAAYLIFAATYVVLAIGRVPGLRIDRTGAAIIGAALMIAAGVLTVPEAYAAINYDTIMLLFGMMIVVANLPRPPRISIAGRGVPATGRCAISIRFSSRNSFR